MNAHQKKMLNIVGTLLGIGMLIWFFTLISFHDLIEGIQELSWGIIALTALLSLLSYYFRAARFYHPLNKRIPMYDLFIISLIHTFTNTALPARSGEFSFLYYGKKYSGLPLGYLTSSLVFIRYIELFVLASSFPIMLAFVPTRNAIFTSLYYASGVLCILMIIGFIFALLYQKHILTWLNKQISTSKIKKYAVRFFIHFFEMLRDVSARPTHIAWCFFYTVLVWYTAFFSTYLLVLALDIPFNFAQSTLSGLFVILTGLLPISGFMGIGLWEGAWVIALTLQGVDHEVAITSGIVMHALRALLLVIFGGLGFTLHHFRKEPVVTPEPHDQTPQPHSDVA
ncbi:MAG: flippase-like domain-containing protein [Candidatus Kerfeldbacteria bacterium]|nr:flippase-like domain-containing protein [Candidatus Kerfeldbacteria bacterium]